MMQTYTADAEAQMLAEVTRLQERLAAITAAADTKMVQLEDELGEVKDPQRRQAIIRLQRLVQVRAHYMTHCACLYTLPTRIHDKPGSPV